MGIYTPGVRKYPRTSALLASSAGLGWSSISVGAGPRSLRRVPHPTRLRLAGKGARRQDSEYLSGALLDAWYAPNLRGDIRTGLGSWSKDDIADFLKYGHNRGETAFGSMIDVVNNSAPYLSDGDINAIAVYLKSLSATSKLQAVAYDDATTAALRSGRASQPGATIYTGTCVNCHGFDGKGFGPYTPVLAGNPVVLDNDPSSLINLVLNGSNPLVVKGTPDPYRMPQFRQQYSDQEIADVVTLIRNGWRNRAPAVTVAEIAKLRKATDPASDQIIILKIR